MLRKELIRENKRLQAQLTRNIGESTDTVLSEVNEHLKTLVSISQCNKLPVVHDGELALVSAKIVDTRISFKDGRKFVEYKIAIESNPRRDFFVWYRYTIFRNLIADLQSQSGYSRKDIPKFPPKLLFGNFSEKNIASRMEKLNIFLDNAINAKHLQWGIRADSDNCVYKRCVKPLPSH